jgi:leucyl aminopeptidase
MAGTVQIGFSRLSTPTKGTVFVLTDKSLKLTDTAAKVAKDFPATFKKAAGVVKFEGGVLKTLDILAPAGSGVDRIVVVGLGDPEKMNANDWLRLGGTIGGSLGSATQATIVLERCDGVAVEAAQAAAVAQGVTLRRYTFDKYKTKSNGKKPKPCKVSVSTARNTTAARAWAAESQVADGVAFARDLVNEPANALGPLEFAARLVELKKLGVAVEVLDEKALARNKMGALLGVARGSSRPPRVVVMTWKGGKPKEPPVAFVGKGVVFDTGGISIKPSAGMEDMKGDMGGAAAVAGLMHAVAGRKAKANIVGIVGLVENMPDGDAQRPGDIVTSMSGQTVEVLNTDAEGRLVLADILTYVQKKAKPSHMIDLATLTGAVIVALGHHHAGMFSNNDELASGLAGAAVESGEKVWRMPLGPEYDKMIESKTADMKNIGGRWAGSITAAQFIQRFVENDTPWAHLDIAGTAMGSPASETNRSWGSGFGVRLLDAFVRARFE